MANWFDEVSKTVARGQAPRRMVLKVGGIAGALAVAGIPTLALADNEHGKGKGKGKGKGHDHSDTNPFEQEVAGSANVPGGAPFSGTLQITQFSAAPTTLAPMQAAIAAPTMLVTGLLTGTFTNPLTGAEIMTLENAAFTALATITQPPSGSCQILNLVLGPLTLDLLGLVVIIPLPIIINVFAVPGAGNLLGNLLCDVAGLLDPGKLNSLIAGLNTLLASV